MKYIPKKMTVICGYYGCGKTNLSVNLALEARKHGSAAIIDADVVNPFFRSADFAELMSANDIHLVCPQYANTNLDIPVINFDLKLLSKQYGFCIVDAGGDDAGAYPLGRFRGLFDDLSDTADFLYVYNKYRRPDYSPQEAAETLRSIEAAGRFKCTALVNNSNIGAETALRHIKDSLSFGEELERLTGLEHAFMTIPEGISGTAFGDFDTFTVKRYVKLPWE